MYWENVRQQIKGLDCIEIGGPTELFSNLEHNSMLYDVIQSIDGINIFEDNPFQDINNKEYTPYGSLKGILFNIDAAGIESASTLNKKYSVVLSAHVLEHIANPIRAITSWKNLLKDHGFLLIIVPEKSHCFDINREYTQFSHILDDYNNQTDEADLSHLVEIKNKSAFPPRFFNLAQDNYKARVLHHHVYNLETLRETCEYCGFKTLYSFNNEKNKLQNIYLGQLKGWDA